ncbi:hypothetical protein M9H77_28471 [Catharanthus roseus]|uniref:Uncharacterized protein n=1 Tax=Catharanthus roseus TaxID=4058 RepID=A0ACC0AJQ8_CATRO|nr:hypothetical protein M9H77_28471 [Catharanthus roseus]
MLGRNLNRVNNNVVKEKADEEPFEVREVEIQPQVDEPKGFSIAKKSGSKGNGGSFRKYQTIACNKGRKSTGNKYSKRIECPTRLSIILRDNSVWEVSKFIEEHNHELDPSMSRFMVAHRIIHTNVKRKLEANDMAGIMPSKSEIKRMWYCYAQNSDLVRKKEMHMRWRKDVIRRHKRIFFGEGYPHMSMEFEKYKELEKIFNEIMDLAFSSEARILKFNQLLESNKAEVLNCNKGARIVVNQSTKSEGMVVLNPNVAVPRGRPQSNCLRAANESGRRNRRRVDNSGRHASNAHVHLKMVQDLKATEQMYQQQFKEKRKFMKKP